MADKKTIKDFYESAISAVKSRTKSAAENVAAGLIPPTKEISTWDAGAGSYVKSRVIDEERLGEWGLPGIGGTAGKLSKIAKRASPEEADAFITGARKLSTHDPSIAAVKNQAAGLNGQAYLDALNVEKKIARMELSRKIAAAAAGAGAVYGGSQLPEMFGAPGNENVVEAYSRR
jgi:hypothetical protein